MNYKIIKKLFEVSGLNLKQVFKLVSSKIISKEQFHDITSYNYDSLKEIKGW